MSVTQSSTIDLEEDRNIEWWRERANRRDGREKRGNVKYRMLD